MGGRGSFSVTGLQRTANMRNVGGASDRRTDVQQAFREIGFSDVKGTNGIETSVLGAYAIALNRLEREYGAVGASDDPKFVTGNSRDVKAAVFYHNDKPSDQFMAINPDMMGMISTNVRLQRSSESQGFHAPTDGRITSEARYAITHEYGHMLSNALAAKNAMTASAFSDRAASEIRQIAERRYGATRSDNVSTYGTTNNAEFFAESFASHNSGAPNAFGRAMGDWLKDNRL